MNLPVIVSTLLAYLFLNHEYFHFLFLQTGRKVVFWKSDLIVPFINFACFFVLSMVNSNLVFNWIAVLLLMLVETRYIVRLRWRKCLLCALGFACIGLALSVFARSLFALILDAPQSAFDADSREAGNIKGYPVALGFMLAGVVFALLNRFLKRDLLAIVFANDRSRRFFTLASVLMFAYLCSILVLYSLPDNEVILKAWGMKVAVSVCVALPLALFYAYRSAYLIKCGREARQLDKAVAQRREQNRALLELAIHDVLTGVFTRPHIEEQLNHLLHASDCAPTVAFIDVDDLKGVNDRHGHEAGDAYLIAVSDILKDFCHREEGEVIGRFGGDEFLMVFPHSDEATAHKRLEEAEHRLRTEGERRSYPSPLSISFGLAKAHRGESPDDLIARADAAMYRHKGNAR